MILAVKKFMSKIKNKKPSLNAYYNRSTENIHFKYVLFDNNQNKFTYHSKVNCLLDQIMIKIIKELLMYILCQEIKIKPLNQ